MADTIRTQSADGVTHEFPAGTADDVVDKVMKQYAEEHTNKTSTMQQVWRGMEDPFLGVGQLAAHVVPQGPAADPKKLRHKVYTPPGAPEIDKYVADRETNIQNERGNTQDFDWARLTGNMLSPVNYVGVETPLPGMIEAMPRVANAAKAMIGGATAGAAQPVADTDNYGSRKATDVGIGSALGGILGIGGSAVSKGVEGVGTWLARNRPENLDSEAVQRVLRRINQDAKAGGPTAADAIDLINAADRPTQLTSASKENLQASLKDVYPKWQELRKRLDDGVITEKELSQLDTLNKTVLSRGARADTEQVSKKPVALVDILGSNVKGLAGAVTRKPGDGKAIAEQFLTKRDEEAGKRLEADIAKNLFSGQSAYQATQALLEGRSSAAKPLYEQTRNLQNVWSPRLDQFFAHPAVKTGLNRGYEIESMVSLARGEPLTATQMGVDIGIDGSVKMLGKPNMRLLDMAKQGLDAMIADERNPLTGRLSARGIAIDEMRRAYLTEIDKLDTKGVYKKARESWGGYSQSLDAIRYGRTAFTNSPEEIAGEMAKMTPSQQEFVRLGVADTVRERLMKAGMTGDESKQLIKSWWTREQLRPVFKSPDEFNRFVEAVTTESKMFATKQKLTGGSDTAARRVEDESSNEGWEKSASIMGQLLTGHAISAAKTAYKFIQDTGLKDNPEINARVAKILFTSDLPDTNRMVQMLRQGKAAPKTNPLAGASNALATSRGAVPGATDAAVQDFNRGQGQQ